MSCNKLGFFCTYTSPFSLRALVAVMVSEKVFLHNLSVLADVAGKDFCTCVRRTGLSSCTPENLQSLFCFRPILDMYFLRWQCHVKNLWALAVCFFPVLAWPCSELFLSLSSLLYIGTHPYATELFPYQLVVSKRYLISNERILKIQFNVMTILFHTLILTELQTAMCVLS